MAYNKKKAQFLPQILAYILIEMAAIVVFVLPLLDVLTH